jgi:hypothetical protein
MDNKGGEVKDSFQVGAEDSFQVGERLEHVQSSVDPMEEEAIQTLRPTVHQSARPLRSVEPIVAMAGLVLSDPVGMRSTKSTDTQELMVDARGTLGCSAAMVLIGQEEMVFAGGGVQTLHEKGATLCTPDPSLDEAHVPVPLTIASQPILPACGGAAQESEEVFVEMIAEMHGLSDSMVTELAILAGSLVSITELV